MSNMNRFINAASYSAMIIGGTVVLISLMYDCGIVLNDTC